MPGQCPAGAPARHPAALRRPGARGLARHAGDTSGPAWGESMPLVKAGSAEFLLVGQHGKLVNKGTAIQAWLRPGSIYIRVPSTKVEAAFEFTQETRDGIPLRFKGIFVYRVTDPIPAAGHFDFWDITEGIGQVTALLTHILLGELRDAVSHLTMPECIEGRKTTLTGVAAQAL